MTTGEKTPILLIGGGGHCASVIDVIESTGQYEIVGIVEAVEADQTSILGYPVVGTDEHLEHLIKQTPHCVITVGQVKNAVVRKMLFKKIKQFGGILPTIISPFARVARGANIGEGTVVMHYVLVNNFAFVGHNTILNNRSQIEHHVIVGNHCHISTSAVLNGEVEVDDECFIGSGAIVNHGQKICKQTLVGAGSVVTKDILHSGIYMGVPARHKEGAHQG